MAHIIGLSSMAMGRILADLAESYERRNGRSVAFTSIGGVEAETRVRAGEAADVVVLASNVMERLESEGHIVSASRADLARSGMAIAVRSGADQPSVQNEAAVKEAILRARAICYSTGPSGEHVKKLLARWRIADVVSRRAIQAPPGVPVGTIVSHGEADLGFQQLSELVHVPNIDILGPLPAEIQLMTVFTAGVCSTSVQRDAARGLINYLTSLEAQAAKGRYGMESA